MFPDMSQLDVSISLSHFFGLLFCFYMFLHYVTIILIRFWYNQKLRLLEYECLEEQIGKLDSINLIKRILKL